MSRVMDPRRILTIGLIIALLPITLLGATIGGTSNADAQTPFEYGVASCNVSPGSNNCVPLPIAFNPKFTRTPQIVVVGSAINQSLSFGTVHPSDTIDLTGTNGTGWWDWKIPSAVTEWLGVTNSSIRTNLVTFSMTQATLEVWVRRSGALGSGFSACLNLQYSSNGGASWTDLFPVGFGGCAGVNVGEFNINDCQFTNPNIVNVPCEAVVTVAVPLVLSTLSSCDGIASSGCDWFRVVGSGGDGVTEVSLGAVYLILNPPYFANVVADCFVELVNQDGQGNFVSMVVLCIVPVLVLSSTTVTFTWTAFVCRTGGSSC